MRWDRFKKNSHEIDPDEIFLDASNIPRFDTHQFEGRMEKPIARGALFLLGGFFLIVCGMFLWKSSLLQIVEGKTFREQADGNRLRQTLVPTERGVIFDRNGNELAWNGIFEDAAIEFPKREYIRKNGFGHPLGYIQYPAKDKFGFFWEEETKGKAGIELAYDSILRGENGMKIVETNAFEEKQGESVTKKPIPGQNVFLSIDMRVQEKLHESMAGLARGKGFRGGAGILMDVRTGEVLSLASFPEYDPETLSLGKDGEKIERYVKSQESAFLNRAVSGLYTPGSIMKLFLSIGALAEGVIEPETEILSTGSISIPHPYLPGEESVFNDWKAHGMVHMRKALAVSSNVYFFEIGGGYKDQKGLGILNIEKYMRLFGFGEKTELNLPGEEMGLIPNPAWKTRTFSEIWRVGDTYNTAIGQYGFQITPIQAVTAVAAIANGGTVLIPRLVVSRPETHEEREEMGLPRKAKRKIAVSEDYFKVVREGMRQAVLEGTAQGLYLPAISIAAKTGTAELGVGKQYVNSWVVGFFPYEEPRYAFAVVMEHGPRENTIGALYVMRKVLEWMAVETPEYAENEAVRH